jgi:hypothetical protein
MLKSIEVKPGRLTTSLKGAGGKELELRYILPLIPPFDHYYEPYQEHTNHSAPL